MSKKKLPTTIQNNIFIIIPFLLTIFGIFMIYEASSITALRLYGEAFLFVKQQAVWFVVALGAFFIFYSVNYRLWYKASTLFLGISLLLLFLVLIPGLYSTVLGAKRWLTIGGIRIQPSELVKLSLIMYLSSWLSGQKHKKLLPFLLLLGLVIGLIMLQPDLGTATIVGAVAVFLYFISGAAMRYIALLIPLGIGGVLLLGLTSAYRLKRLMTFINPGLDPNGMGYHVQQINIALSLGGLWGSGFGSSRQKFQFLPEAHTDSIFAIIGENFGFIGTVIVILSYFMILVYGYRALQKVQDRFGFLLGSGTIFLITAQAIINLGAMVQLLPLTGAPLPFISYGGSSLVTFYSLTGILMNILRQHSSTTNYSTRRRR